MSGDYRKILAPDPYVNALVLTVNFQAGPAVNLSAVSPDKIAIALDWDGVDPNQLEVLVEWSHDGATFFRPIVGAVAITPAGVAGNYVATVCNPGGLLLVRFSFREVVADGSELTARLSAGTKA